MSNNMFLENLSTAVLKICDRRNLSYEVASAQCDLSTRYFGEIARGKTAPILRFRRLSHLPKLRYHLGDGIPKLLRPLRAAP